MITVTVQEIAALLPGEISPRCSRTGCKRACKRYGPGDHGKLCPEHSADASRRQQEHRDKARAGTANPRRSVSFLATGPERSLLLKAASRANRDLTTWLRETALSAASRASESAA